ncbi:hypothetical protein C2845_PM03G26800 [Panicum miliaceum]|uniref:DUF4283 domain-containing protein n=1 Tax=Panicum miliaceum TaxID=4540 RepID=A0A3L6T7M6_PANMI|nr:hypothetical protein C2845_PM03G26800 [Panicum miliaceum]
MEQLARFKGSDFQTAIVKGNVVPTYLSAGLDGNLDVVWIKAYNFPSNAKSVEVVMEVEYLVRDPEEVDMSSLNKPGQVRVQIACRDFRKVRGETQFDRQKDHDGGDAEDERGEESSFDSQDVEHGQLKEGGKQSKPGSGGDYAGSNKKQ